MSQLTTTFSKADCITINVNKELALFFYKNIGPDEQYLSIISSMGRWQGIFGRCRDLSLLKDAHWKNIARSMQGATNTDFEKFYNLFWPLFAAAVKEQAKTAEIPLSPEQAAIDSTLYVPVPSLVGMPTATTAVDGRTIHVGDVVGWKDSSSEFIIKFEENEIRQIRQPDGESFRLLSDNRTGKPKIFIIKKYFEQ